MNKIYKIYSINYYENQNSHDGAYPGPYYIWDGIYIKDNSRTGGTQSQQEINEIIKNSINSNKYLKYYKNINQLSLEL